MNVKQLGANYLKNVFGWKTNRKLVVFSVDDYGNVRIDSNAAMINLKKSGFAFDSRFDRLDSLETREDLESLYEVLTSVKDKNGNHAKFTPYALPCNINFEAMAASDYAKYQYEELPKTYEKLSERDSTSYQGTWALWQEGIDKKLMQPQFHGREHFNLKIFNDLLGKHNENFLLGLKHQSYVEIPEHKNYPNSWTAAYSFQEKEETETFIDNIKDGLKKFKEVYGYDATVFTPPAQQFPLHLEPDLIQLSLSIDKPRRGERHLGSGKFQTEKNYLGGGINGNDIVRNVVFEPNMSQHVNWVDFTFKQVEAAFNMKKPANISSHRVNFCGHIDTKNREVSLKALKDLLQKIVRKWPEVEFISAAELATIMSKSRK